LRDNSNQNQANKQLKALRIFHRTPDVRDKETNTRAQRALEKLESFDPATQEQYRLLPAIIDTQWNADQAFYNLTSISLNSSHAQQNHRLEQVSSLEETLSTGEDSSKVVEVLFRSIPQPAKSASKKPTRLSKEEAE
jgi:adenosine deaminase